MKKLILVTPGIRFNPMGVPVLSVNGTYMNAIAAAGGIPVMLGSTQQEIEQKIADYEAKGIIRGYKALIDWDKTGTEKVTALPTT